MVALQQHHDVVALFEQGTETGLAGGQGLGSLVTGIGVEGGQQALEAVGAVDPQAFKLGEKWRAVFAQQQ